MKRRTFLAGIGTVSAGTSALVGSGAFSSTDTRRRTTIETAADADAYLGLRGCPDGPNDVFATTDDGRFVIDLSPSNPTEAGGRGLNAGSITALDGIFELCNDGTRAVCVWIEPFETLPEVESATQSDEIVRFYPGDDPGGSIVGAGNAIGIGVGSCRCIGVRTDTNGVEPDTSLIEDDSIVVRADAGADCSTSDSRYSKN